MPLEMIAGYQGLASNLRAALAAAVRYVWWNGFGWGAVVGFAIALVVALLIANLVAGARS